MRFLIFLATLVGSALPAAVPPYITPCDRKLPDFDDCILKMCQSSLAGVINGDPQFNIPPLDPLFLQKIEVGDTALGQKAVGMSFTCKNCTIEGLKNAKLLKAFNDVKGQHINMVGKIPRMSVKGDYAISGKVLLLPIVGEGKAEMTFDNVDFQYRTDYVLYKGEDGEDYLKIVKTDTSFNVDGFKIHLTNLFNGDQALGDKMNSFLNENWSEMLKEFGPALGNTIGSMITLMINNISADVPLEDIILP